MSLPRPTGLKQPSRIGRPSGLPTTRPVTPSSNGTTQQPQNNASIPTKAMSAIAKSARGVGFCPEHANQYADKVSKDLKGPEPLDEQVILDDFKIADRIWVSGNKPGIIAFIGETQFAPGEWAGIVLDESIGKNDGSVMGVRYFQCEPKKGVFSRLNKLSHAPLSSSRRSSQGHDSNSSETKLSNPDLRASNGTTNGTTNNNSQSRPSSRLGSSASKHLSTSSSSLHKASSAGSTPTGTGNSLNAGKSGGVKIGDRVLVSGSKSGILRFIGEADFAKGVWAGVELEEPLGKNDGAVAGKRYFDCRPMHGLFAPIHKISPVEHGALTPSPHLHANMSTSMRSSRERSGSQESVSSMSSTASSVSRSRVRLGVTSLASQLSPRVDQVAEASKSGQRPNSLNLSATTAALQKALKEKEEHIEQLLRERDLERSEVARAAAHVDEAESQLTYVKTEQSKLRLQTDEEIAKYRVLVADLENEKQELLAFLEEEKRRVEDLQFQLEEETLKDDSDSKTSSTNDLQVKELERQIKKEKDRADTLEKDVSQLKKKLDDQQKANHQNKTAQTSSQDKIEELTHKLAQAESKVKAFELNRMEDGAKVSQVSMELTEKQKRVKELDDQLTVQRREMSSMSQQLQELKEELKASNDKRKKQDEYIKELVDKLKETENRHNDMMDEIRNANSNTSDLQRQLSASKTKAEELATERAILESQLSKLMANSGDSSSQLATLNDQLTERNRKIEDLQNDLLSYSQKVAKLQEEYQGLLQEKDREIQKANQNYHSSVGRLQDEISELKLNEEKYKTKINQLSESLDLEKHETSQFRETQFRDLQQQLSSLNEELSKQQDKTTAHKQLLERVTLEKEAVQYEKQQSEKQLRRVEEEKSAINTELIQAKVEATKHQEDVQKSRRVKEELEDKVEKLNLQLEHLIKSKEEADKSIERVSSQKIDVFKELDLLKNELITMKADVQTKDKLLTEKDKEVTQLQAQSSLTQEELMTKSLKETSQLKQDLTALTKSLQEANQQVESRDAQISDLLAEAQQNLTIAQERDLLFKEKTELLRDKEASEERYKSSLENVETETQRANKLQSDVVSLQSAEEDLRKKKSALDVRVGQLETELEQLRKEKVGTNQKETVDHSGNSAFLQLKEEADFATKQVDFLNSVIVELQNKNQLLQHKLSALEDSGIHTNGETPKHQETPSKIRAPPRLFCDICDEFDLHETEDCPMQEASTSPEPTSYHGDRKSTRPYCDTCEVFGHWTSQCDDEQTF